MVTNKRLDLCAILTAVAALATIAVLMMSAPAVAHEFYDGECCDGRDCQPYRGEVVVNSEGYWIPEFKILVPYKPIRARREGEHPDAARDGAKYNVPGDDEFAYHLCEYPIASGTVRCFYVRPGGV